MFYVCLFIISVPVLVLAYCFHLLASNYWLLSYHWDVNLHGQGAWIGERHNKGTREMELFKDQGALESVPGRNSGT